MINKISLESFKAFGLPVDFLLDSGKNMLAYGENGSGKSSLFEALRLFFYQDQMLDALRKEGEAEEVFEANKKNFLRAYNNATMGDDYTLKVNDQDRSKFPFNKHACYMLGSEDVHLGNYVQVKEFLKGLSLPPFDIEKFWKDKGEELVTKINKAIKDDFKESFTVEIADTYSTLKIDDPTRGVSPEKDLRRFLNEAKLHLVALLLFFETVKLHKAFLGDKIDKVVVLDDIVTSLDATNRIFFVNYLVRDFAKEQIILLTHNVSFFNLVNLRVGNKIDQDAEKWVLYNICEVGDNTDAYAYDQVEHSGKILNDYKALSRTNPAAAASQAGNRIRKCFEAVLYEYAKLIQIDQFEEANRVLARLIDKRKPVFVKIENNKVYGACELLDEIISIVNAAKSSSDKVNEVKTCIDSYQKLTEVKKIAVYLKEIKMFQKVVLHQLSHGTGTHHNFTDKEIRQSIDLLKMFESLVNKIKDENAYGM
jgi:energy-coupling factor transporter ATP-binding protein EcfA2